MDFCNSYVHFFSQFEWMNVFLRNLNLYSSYETKQISLISASHISSVFVWQETAFPRDFPSPQSVQQNQRQ